jgi:flavin reductase (DIM6/NTAB) family NADH-FMN oxidoreductase RutF
VGDHTLFVGEVQEAALNEDPNLKPLLFYASKYRRLADETP